VPPEELAEIAHELTGRRLATYASPAEAWKIAVKNASPEGLICIAGSFFLSGEMRKILS
jgi:folylpolyglutamate synthase/dihydropteroate synthase